MVKAERRRVKQEAKAIVAGKKQAGNDEEEPAVPISMLSDNTTKPKSAADTETKKRRTQGQSLTIMSVGDDDDEEAPKTAADDINILYILWGMSQKVQLAGASCLVRVSQTSRAMHERIVCAAQVAALAPPLAQASNIARHFFKGYFLPSTVSIADC